MKKISELIIQGFKCFYDQKIQFSNLTVFAGVNSLGKSTIIQSVLLSRSIYQKIDKTSKMPFSIPLNGQFLMYLGNTSQVVHKRAKEISFTYKFEDGKSNELILGTRSDYPEIFLEFMNKAPISPADKESNILSSEAFYYLNAERIGPRSSYDLMNLDYNHCGWQGEYSLQMLSEMGITFKVTPKRSINDDKNLSLRHQVIKWMDEIIPGIDIQAKLITEINKAHVTYNGYNPYNVGFGISYVLPVVLNGLIALPGSIYIVENPEAHLHPAGQSKIGYFLAMVASTGIQVIVETHSEHVINGMRLYWLRHSVSSDRFLINFLYKKEGEDSVSIKELKLTEKVELSEWPTGFFDQTQNDLVEMIKLRRSKS